MKSFGKTFDLLIVFLAIILVPRASSAVTRLIWPMVSSIDPDDAFLWITIHHILQLVFTVLLMKLYFKSSLDQWGFNLKNFRQSLKIFGGFSLVYLVFVLFSRFPTFVSGAPPSFDYPLTAANISGYLGFQLFLSGTGEEPLFRGFVMTVLAQSWKGTYRAGNLEIPYAGLWATLFFMIAHIGFSFSPFAITRFSIMQQFVALGLGLYYAIVFHKTRSLFGPMLSHGYSNVAMVGSQYAAAFLMK